MSDESAIVVREEHGAMVNPISGAMAHAEELGMWMVKSGMFGCTVVDQGKILALTCITERITPMQFDRTYDLITTSGGTRPCMKTGAMLAKFRASGGDYTILASDTKHCEIEFVWTVRGKDKTTKYAYTMADAQLAKLTGDNWQKRPKTMLFNRCAAEGLRMFVPELFAGHYLAEELLEDVPATAPPPQADNIEAATPVMPEVLPPSTGPSGGGGGFGGVGQGGELLDRPEPTTIANMLIDARVPVSTAMAFLRDVPHYLSQEQINGVPAAAVFDLLTPEQQARIVDKFDGFCAEVKKYADAKHDATDIPADEAQPAAPTAQKAAAAKRKRKSKPKDDTPVATE